MILKLCTYNNVKNKINKDNGVVVLTTSRYFNFKQPYDVMNPTIILEEPKNHLSYNYIIIEDEEETFKKCYFVIDRIIRSNNMIELNLREDTLYTFKSTLSANNLFIERSSNLYDKTLYDSLLPRKNEQTRVELNPLELASDIELDLTTGEGCYVLTGVSKHLTFPAVKFIKNINDVSIFNYSLVDSTILNRNQYVLEVAEIHEIVPQIINNDALNTFVVSVIKFPFKVKKRTNVNGGVIDVDVYLGDTKMYESQSPITVGDIARYHVMDIDFTKYDFSDTTLYNDNDSPLYLNIPLYKEVQLNYDLIRNIRISVDFFVEHSTGQCNVVISTNMPEVSENRVIYSDIYQLGQPLSFDTTNQKQITNNTIQNTLNTTIGSLGSAATLGFGILSGNPVAVVGGTLGLAKTITGSVNSALNNINRAQTKNIGNIFNYLSTPLIPFLYILKKNYSDNINSFTSINGRLYNNYHIINNDLGYFKIGQNQHLTTSSDMTLQEEQDIRNQLENGVYY